ncbi:mevalonate kinase [archaeon]|nr:mevalonate kinase [archaeon]
MESATASAPGKLFLFGEHAVIHGTPSIVTAVNRRMTITVKKRADDKVTLTAPELGITNQEVSLEPTNRTKENRFVSATVMTYFERTGNKCGLDVTTNSQFHDCTSLGSSSATTVATLKALDKLFETNLSERELFDIGFKAHSLDVQDGRGSGFDIAASVYGGTLFFKKNGDVIEPIKSDKIPISYFSIPGIKFDTATMISVVEADKQKFSAVYDTVLNTVSAVIRQARESLESKDWQTVGRLMNINQSFLESIGVSTPQATKLIYCLRLAGSFGAKITGGGGDNVIALIPQERKKEAIACAEMAGGKNTAINAGEVGCRIEG